MKQVFATRKGRSLCIKMLVNTFVGRAHTVCGNAKAARGAVS
jgi:hypothetical protein